MAQWYTWFVVFPNLWTIWAIAWWHGETLLRCFIYKFQWHHTKHLQVAGNWLWKEENTKAHRSNYALTTISKTGFTDLVTWGLSYFLNKLNTVYSYSHIIADVTDTGSLSNGIGLVFEGIFMAVSSLWQVSSQCGSLSMRLLDVDIETLSRVHTSNLLEKFLDWQVFWQTLPTLSVWNCHTWKRLRGLT